MDTLFGSKKEKTKVQGGGVYTDPFLESLYGLKLNLATQAAAGNIPQGVLDLTRHNTENTMIAGGYGRSGAEGEAVANATMSQLLNYITGLLSGNPSPNVGTRGGSETTSSGQPGLLNLFGTLASGAGALGGSGGLWGKGGIFGPSA